MCPNCRAFVTTDDRVCPYCDVKLGARAVERRSDDDTGGLLGQARFTTTVLLLINFGLYAATTIYSMKSAGGELVTSIDGQTLYAFGAK